MEFNASLVPKDEEDRALIVSKAVVIILICIFGLIANIAVILSILILKEYNKSVTHWYVLQLCLAGAILMITLPFLVSETLAGRWIYPEWMCKAKETVFYLNFYASILFLMVMSIDRYAAICLIFTDIFHTLRKKKSAFIISMCVWSIALLLTIPVMVYSSTNNMKCICTSVFPPERDIEAFCKEQEITEDLCQEIKDLGPDNACSDDESRSGSGSGIVSGSGSGNFDYGSFPESSIPIDQDQNITSTTEIDADDKFKDIDYNLGELAPFNPNDLLQHDCDYVNEPRAWTAFIAFNFSVMFLLPFIVICVFYGLIAHHIETSKVKTAHRIHNDRRRVTVMCGSLVISFMVCWLPFYAGHLAKLDGISASGKTCRIISGVANMIALLNSALNPYLYSCLGPGIARRWRTLKQSPTLQGFFSKPKKDQSSSKDQQAKTHSKSKESPKSRTTAFAVKATITHENENSNS